MPDVPSDKVDDGVLVHALGKYFDYAWRAVCGFHLAKPERKCKCPECEAAPVGKVTSKDVTCLGCIGARST